MERRDFIITSILSIPAFACAGIRRNDPATAQAVVVRAGESRYHQPTPFMGVSPNDLKLSTKDTAGKLSAFDYLGVQKAGPLLHAHQEQDEVFFVLDGEFIFQLGEEKQRLRTGDLIFLPRAIPHTWVQMTDKGQMFYFLQPAGKMEEFFLKLTELDGKGKPEDYEQLGKMAKISNHGPALSPAENHTISEKLSHGFVVRAGKSRFGEKIVIGGVSPNDLKVSGKDTGGELSIFEYFGREKGGPPLHIHLYQDEVFYVAEGRYRFQCGNEQFTLQKGDMIFLPRAVPHTWAQLEQTGRLLFFFQPAGKMEAFFQTIGGSTPPAEGADPFKEHDMKIVGAPLVVE